MKNNFEEDNIEKVIVGLEPSNAVSSSNYVDKCQFKKESETEKTVHCKWNQKIEEIKEVETATKFPEENTELSKHNVICKLCKRIFLRKGSLICHTWRYHKGAEA